MGVLSLTCPLAFCGLVVWLCAEVPSGPLWRVYPYLLIAWTACLIASLVMGIKSIRGGAKLHGGMGVAVSALGFLLVVWSIVMCSLGARPGLPP